MRYKARVDNNQKTIVSFLKEQNCSVLHLHQLGKGCPDLLIAIANQNILVEIKNGSKLTEAQIQFHKKWQGSIEVINNIQEAKKMLKKYAK